MLVRFGIAANKIIVYSKSSNGTIETTWITRDRFKFCVNVKTDIRFVNSYKWAEPIFRILPISALYSSF